MPHQPFSTPASAALSMEAYGSCGEGFNLLLTQMGEPPDRRFSYFSWDRTQGFGFKRRTTSSRAGTIAD
jgi:hypothetical protein